MNIGFATERQALWKVLLIFWGYLVFFVIVIVISVVVGAILGALLAIGVGWLEKIH